ncbi:iron complex transport system substrate-binding protein [Melghiribacillus thermohalophilus]|uniref:Iron complex transport system substrate-binding protein n=1 Tax=Melghiribacillus thermohalophilus TaxID=1324956 RepID=A0A4R3MXA3_9BACI|nr:siderophore ABC transporter substrate-binding protein [Melghiribacillus thermohalophilus]TCT19373.1 iron complex transport system substrate-binding protein [Melghiribacillus thermohalophilus]
MKKLMTIVVLALLAILITACGNAEGSDGEASGDQQEKESLTITHELDETEVEKNPETVVVFDFGALDTLDKLGVEVAGVPKSNLPEYLSKYAAEEYTNVGSLKEPDFETIYGLDPDLIIISGRQSGLYEDLSEIAPTIYVGIDTANYMESFTNNVLTLGKIFGKESQAEEELAKIEEKIQTLKETASENNGKALVTLTTGGKVSAYGPGSRFGLIHDVFGLTPADDNIEASTHGMSISFEFIAEKDPDYLFVIDRDAVVGGEKSAKEVIENELVKQTKAYQNDKIIYLDPNYWYLSGGGLISMTEMIDEVSEGIK